MDSRGCAGLALGTSACRPRPLRLRPANLKAFPRSLGRARESSSWICGFDFIFCGLLLFLLFRIDRKSVV